MLQASQKLSFYSRITICKLRTHESWIHDHQLKQKHREAQYKKGKEKYLRSDETFCILWNITLTHACALSGINTCMRTFKMLRLIFGENDLSEQISKSIYLLVTYMVKSVAIVLGNVPDVQNVDWKRILLRKV